MREVAWAGVALVCAACVVAVGVTAGTVAAVWEMLGGEA